VAIGFGLAVGGGWLQTFGAEDAARDPIEAIRQWAGPEGGTNSATLEAIVRQSLNQPLQAIQVEPGLLAVLSSEGPLEARRYACRQLRLVGGDRSIPVLTRLLFEPDLAHLARAALEAMPSPAASTALRQAITGVKGDLQIGLVNSLGQRREPFSVPVLANLLNHRDVALVRAVTAALGRIGGESALDPLSALAGQFDPAFAEGTLTRVRLSDEVKLRLDGTLVADALLECADGLARNGKADVAAGIQARIYITTFVSRAQRLAALQGLVRTDPTRAMPLLIKTLRATDPALPAFAAACARDLPSEAGAQLLPLVDAFPATVQALLLEALAERQGPSMRTNLIRATRSPEPSIQAAAVRSLARIEATAEVVRLLAEIAAGQGPVATEAQNSLDRVRGTTVDDTMLACVAQGSAGARVAAIRSVIARRMTVALPALRRAAEDKEPAVREAAVAAVAALTRK
jgi:HEAT repeat protein